ncbi:hypothetical protein [uncultured Methanofollis sp.]|uniref:DUF7289 family protein n=1 Tax=uncultured Methanofollis sp. TaxID=262500 RepID=UPI00261EF6F6|nr:hypothetical protein [uncultured Methanofollis sp.]
MYSPPDEDALSEVVGFVLLLGVLVLALSVYQLYAVPAEGRENEITHMNMVKDRFTDYKIALDSLWVNNQTGVALSTAFDLGTGQYGGWPLLLAPTASAGDLSIGTGDVLTIRTGDNPEGWETRLGTLEYTSENHYWVDQTWTYEMGGVFLTQDEGTTLRLAPLFSVSSRDGTVASVSITPATVRGSGSVGGTGPARVETRLRQTAGPSVTEEQVAWVQVSIESSSSGRALAWERALKEAPGREGIPQEWYRLTRSGNTASIFISGPDQEDGERKDVLLQVHRAEYYASLHGAAARIA